MSDYNIYSPQLWVSRNKSFSTVDCLVHPEFGNLISYIYDSDNYELTVTLIDPDGDFIKRISAFDIAAFSQRYMECLASSQEQEQHGLPKGSDVDSGVSDPYESYDYTTQRYGGPLYAKLTDGKHWSDWLLCEIRAFTKIDDTDRNQFIEVKFVVPGVMTGVDYASRRSDVWGRSSDMSVDSLREDKITIGKKECEKKDKYSPKNCKKVFYAAAIIDAIELILSKRMTSIYSSEVEAGQTTGCAGIVALSDKLSAAITKEANNSKEDPDRFEKLLNEADFYCNYEVEDFQDMIPTGDMTLRYFKMGSGNVRNTVDEMVVGPDPVLSPQEVVQALQNLASVFGVSDDLYGYAVYSESSLTSKVTSLLPINFPGGLTDVAFIIVADDSFLDGFAAGSVVGLGSGSNSELVQQIAGLVHAHQAAQFNQLSYEDARAAYQSSNALELRHNVEKGNVVNITSGRNNAGIDYGVLIDNGIFLRQAAIGATGEPAKSLSEIRNNLESALGNIRGRFANVQQLKSSLEGKGFVFESPADQRILEHVMEYLENNDDIARGLSVPDLAEISGYLGYLRKMQATGGYKLLVRTTPMFNTSMALRGFPVVLNSFNLKSSQHGYAPNGLSQSFISGVYVILGIKHSATEGGAFTEFSLVKTGLDSMITKKVDEDAAQANEEASNPTPPSIDPGWAGQFDNATWSAPSVSWQDFLPGIGGF